MQMSIISLSLMRLLYEQLQNSKDSLKDCFESVNSH